MVVESKVKPENFVTLSGFMITDLQLKGNELIVYAIIYGFSQAEGTAFRGSAQYLADWTNSTRQGVMKNLKSLMQKGLIDRRAAMINGRSGFEYYATKFTCKQSLHVNGVDTTCKQSLHDLSTEFTPTCKQSLHNNIDNNIADNIVDNIDTCASDSDTIKKASLKEFENDFEEVWKAYPKKQGKEAAKKAYIKARKAGTSNLEIIKGLTQYKLFIQANNTADKYIKHGSTWFNQKCWEDDYSINEKPAANNTVPSEDDYDFERGSFWK